MSHLHDARAAVCAIARLQGAGDDVKAMCKAGEVGIEEARKFIKSLEEMPPTLLADVVAMLGKDLDELLTGEADKLLESVAGSVKPKEK